MTRGRGLTGWEGMMRKLLLLISLMVAVVAFAASLSPAQSAPADATFAVNDQNDAVDSNLADGQCIAANGKCSLRAAIQQANALYALNPGSTYTVIVPGGLTFQSPPRLYALTLGGGNEDNAVTGDLDC